MNSSNGKITKRLIGSVFFIIRGLIGGNLIEDFLD